MLDLINGPASATAGVDSNFFSGYARPSRAGLPTQAVTEAHNAFARIKEGRTHRIEVSETFTTSDFKMAAFAPVETKVMQKLSELPSVWRQYTDTITVNDFRPTRLLDKWAANLGLKLVPELTEFPKAGGGDFEQWWINVVKYGLADGISFEAQVNNEAIAEIENLPTKLANAAGEQEAINALSNLLKVDAATNLASDVNTDFFKTANGNAPANVPLNADNLDAAINATLSKKNKRGKAVAAPVLQLVIPTTLRHTAERIRNLRTIEVTDGDTKLVYDNFLKSVDVVVDPMLDVINSHAKAATTWFLLPKTGSVRPALFAAFLRGYETPQVAVRSDSAVVSGGGAATSFELDSIDYRVRHVLGHQTGDATFTYASYGS